MTESTRRMSEDVLVSWLKIPIVGLPEMACQVNVTPQGRTLDDDGEPLPMEDRTEVCGRDGRWMLGAVFLCQIHAAEVAMVSGDNIDDIEAAWREQL